LTLLQVLEKGKQDILRKHGKNSTEEPGWHEEIASDSEAFVSSCPRTQSTHTTNKPQVKAHRGEIDASAAEIARLQNKTKNPPKQ
jgi:hypothetical protein